MTETRLVVIAHAQQPFVDAQSVWDFLALAFGSDVQHLFRYEPSWHLSTFGSFRPSDPSAIDFPLVLLKNRQTYVLPSDISSAHLICCAHSLHRRVARCFINVLRFHRRLVLESFLPISSNFDASRSRPVAV